MCRPTCKRLSVFWQNDSPTTSKGLRVREEINLHFQESRRPYGKARGGRIAGYLTDEQRSLAEWIGALKCEVIFECALRSLLIVGELFCQKTDNLVHVGRHMFPKKINQNGTQMFPENGKRIVT